MKRFMLLTLLLLSLPILLHVYQPEWRLGGLGLLFGTIGYTISPIILFVILLRYIWKAWWY
ncbi:hypothetical protein A2673_01605 [Candidatus Kaiserbacteria bacterium RIFCSPHIGHO2_01_FULL_50_13]|uniref:Uncharacterized protein n=1 Tax=Candidatus Kaiserbacteria bacterium RIFCSPLOWO2_01_FULL_50_24 TaxID=1798507 RepID=A0A1F6EMG4_9BACT|nr:MAG: hypothetical protein A2673_01605 [Candidatus Kaiserbacteria bacterium RIFCSPHIGHO2_01_FULL_50_13]OGG74818.1 MAG: hypothetical protein A3A34_00305 [Candidatus Kaiserbacteria bacterium RIFCSPLOWO2_01_FULL_50_24]OGG81401.1 MAG: hypothetical protein A3H74_03090 [Candidatus Kaiserbacteria bacterium RIFCSPLOWO2_02_FULL_51_13]